MKLPRLFAFVLAALTTLPGCADLIYPNRQPEVAIEGDTLITAIGATTQLHTVTRENLVGYVPRWESSNPAVATVNERGIEGYVTARANGRVKIIARVADATASRWITVSQKLENIVLDPPFKPVVVNGTIRLAGKALDRYKNEIANQTITFTTLSPELLQPISGGSFQGVAPGVAKVAATVGPFADTVEVGVGVVFKSITSGIDHTCGLTDSGEVWCWGSNVYGQRGTGTAVETCFTNCAPQPTRVNTEERFVSIDAGSIHTCGLTASGMVYCWGGNELGQLGNDTSNRECYIHQCTPFPVRVNGLPAIAGFGAGGSHTCAFSVAQEVWCWGSNAFHQTGVPTGTSQRVPVRAQTNRTFSSLHVGDGHNCGLTATGEAWCWGSNTGVELGVPRTVVNTRTAQPVRVNTTQAFDTISAGAGHNCAITTAGATFCWGLNDFGQIGNGQVTNAGQPTPVEVTGSHSFIAVAAGYRQTCALTLAGGVYCWGNENQPGLTGSGTPKLVPFPEAARSISAGNAFACATGVSGATYCWGGGYYGRLGAGSRFDTTTPVHVFGPRVN